MADWRTELRRTWAMLEPGRRSAIETIVLTPGMSPPIRVYLSEDGSRHLLVPAGHSRIDNVRGDALIREERTLDFGDAFERYLDVACLQPNLFEVFDELLASVVEASVQSGDPLTAAVSALRRWTELLSAWAAGMSHDEEMGLFAELYVLDRLTRHGGHFAPEIWRGPLHEAKDLVAASWWIEVKAVGIQSTHCRIHGLDQLADMDGVEDGYLAVATVVQSESGRSVGDLVAGLRARCTDAPAFDELLLRARWVARDPANRWTVPVLDLVPVGSCPRLTVSGSPPIGVGRVRYDVDLTIARAHALADAEAEIVRLAGSP